MTIPTFSQIRAQVAAIRRHAADAGVFGIRTAGRWTGEHIRTGQRNLLHRPVRFAVGDAGGPPGRGTGGNG